MTDSLPLNVTEAELDAHLVYEHPQVTTALRKRGREFLWTPRPKGYRYKRAMKACYRNAAAVALKDFMLGQDNGAIYCEGFARTFIVGHWVQHAWITLDGKHAIDVTWPDDDDLMLPNERGYFGVTFELKEVSRAMIERDGIAGSLLAPWYGTTAKAAA